MTLAAHLILFCRRARTGLASRWANLYFKAAGVRIEGRVWLRNVEIPRDFYNVELAHHCALDTVTLLCAGEPSDAVKLRIGPGTYVNRGTFFDAIESLTVGEQTAIGPGCYITDHDHGVDPSRAPLDQPMTASPTKIGSRVWIGANVVILKGVTIGDDTIVGAGSVVTRSLPANVIAVGTPARVIRERSRASSPAV